jgi:hypothetical protein
MTSQVLKLKVKATRAFQELNEVAQYTQYGDEIDNRGLVDIVAVDDCQRILGLLKQIHAQQKEL